MATDDDLNDAIKRYLENNEITQCPSCLSGPLPQEGLGETDSQKWKRWRNSAMNGTKKKNWVHRRALKSALGYYNNHSKVPDNST